VVFFHSAAEHLQHLGLPADFLFDPDGSAS